MKACTKCKQEKPASDFYKKSGTRTGLTSRCKPCHNADWKARDARYRERNTTTYKAAQVRHKLKGTYGITPCEFTKQLIMQSGVCAVCGTNDPGGKGAWNVDHDHKTGDNRGLLCQHCNLLLGHAKDNVETLRSAIRYLEVEGVWSWN